MGVIWDIFQKSKYKLRNLPELKIYVLLKNSLFGCSLDTRVTVGWVGVGWGLVRWGRTGWGGGGGGEHLPEQNLFTGTLARS